MTIKSLLSKSGFAVFALVVFSVFAADFTVESAYAGCGKCGAHAAKEKSCDKEKASCDKDKSCEKEKSCDKQKSCDKDKAGCCKKDKSCEKYEAKACGKEKQACDKNDQGKKSCCKADKSCSADSACKKDKACSKESHAYNHKHKHGEQKVAGVFKTRDFELNAHDGKEVKLSDYAGKKIVVLEWFNHKCPFVVPHYKAGTMARLAEKYKDKDVVWFAVNSTNTVDPKNNKKWAKQYDLPYAILDDSNGKVGKKFDATNTPQIFIITKKGNIAYEGAVDNAPRGKVKGEKYVNYVDRALTQLTSGKEVETSKTRPYGCSVKYAKK